MRVAAGTAAEVDRPMPEVGARAELVFANARIVRPDEIIRGSLHVIDGMIVDIGPAATNVPSAIDLGGEYLLPGLIDVHTDNIEKHIIPRPGVLWDGMSAAAAHDMVLASAGITTVFDSLCVGTLGKPDRRHALPAAIEGLQRAERHGLLRTNHFLHLRCDVTEPGLAADLAPYLENPALRFVTVLEDSAARDPEHFRFTLKKRGMTESDVADTPAETSERRRWLAAECRRRGIPWGNHDDTKAWHVAEGVELGMRIAEFPLTREAVEAAHKAGMAIIGGAPNVVAGRSHTKFLSMRELVSQERVTALCSDYVPASLLHAVLRLTRDPIGLPLSRAVKLVSQAPAELFGLSDRGTIDVGRRADLIHVAFDDRAPILRASWHCGQRIV